MGLTGSRNALAGETLRDMSSEVFLSEDEVLRSYDLFWRVCQAETRVDVEEACVSGSSFGGSLPKEGIGYDPRVWHAGQMRIEQFLCMPAVRYNIFAPRIFEIFAHASGGLPFASFLLMASSFSKVAPEELKHVVAFRLYDLDNDGVISPADVSAILDVFKHQCNPWLDAAAKASSDPDNGAHPWTDSFPELPGVSATSVACTSPHEGDIEADEKARTSSVTIGTPLASSQTSAAASAASTAAAQTKETLVQRVFATLDLDGSNELAEVDFSRLLHQIPNFHHRFTIPLLDC